jgi:hypothetical protein
MMDATSAVNEPPRLVAKPKKPASVNTKATTPSAAIKQPIKLTQADRAMCAWVQILAVRLTSKPGGAECLE